MARKPSRSNATITSKAAPTGDAARLRRPAEQRYAEELAGLAGADADPRPPGWRLSAKAVRRFIIGDDALGVTRKFYGDDALVDRAIVTLISAQGLMLVRERTLRAVAGRVNG